MKRESSPVLELNLLLEDYGKSPRQWPDGSASGAAFRDRAATRRTAGGFEDLGVSFLLEDYRSRTARWLTRSSSLGATRGGASQLPEHTPYDADLPDLQLLLQDYDPGLRFAARRQSRVRGDGFGKGGRTDLGAETIPEASASPAMPMAAPPPAEGERGPKTGERVTRLPLPAAELAEQRTATQEDEDGELSLLLSWDEDVASARQREARAIAVALHALLIVVLILQPRISAPLAELGDLGEDGTVTLLLPPPDELARLTQKEPNKGPLTTEFRGLPEPPRPLIVLPKKAELRPPAASDQAQPKVEKPASEEAADQPKPEPPQPAGEEPAPSLPAARSPNPGEFREGSELARLRDPNELRVLEPRPPPQQKPKLTLEDPTAFMPGRRGPSQLGTLKLNARPDEVIEGAIEEAAKRGGGTQAVGDDFGTGGLGGYLPPSPGNAGSNLELLSDPRGVDFRPYLIQVLAAVRRNWYAVIPESARLGMTRGRVAIQFAIVRDGTVSKLVIAGSSGIQSLDRAAVAGISASHPFSPLPRDYSGSDIRLQFIFLYNIKTR